MGMKIGNMFMSTAGYAEYRYGPKKKPTLSPVRLVKGGARERLISGVMEALKDWRFSEFEHEAETRHALRIFLISKGFRWEPSDADAAAMIAKALDRIGAKRPSWLEGQREYAATRDQCLWCGGWIDDEDQSRGRRFCSPMCAKSCRETRAAKEERYSDATYQRALIEIMDANAPERPCKACKRPFRSRFKSSEYCSRECFAVVRRLPDRSCLSCESVFKPSDHTKRYCCRECAYVGIAKTREWKLPEIACSVCCGIFRPKTTSAMYCSKYCSSLARNAARRAVRRQGNVIYLTRDIFDSWFHMAA